MRCPTGQFCFRGECAFSETPDAGTPTEDGGVADGGTFDAGDPEDRVLAAGGCFCRAGSSGGDGPLGLGLLVAVLGLALVRRRAR
ncbi:MAG: hypothetical protein M5U28_54280 [Sandaracinaceae bacterium]|nr:hypothetical protein [Sandaracinaceae bacterium]